MTFDWLRFLLLLLAVTLRFFDLGEGPSARALVVFPPVVVGAGGPVHGPLDHSVKRLSSNARSVAFPPMLLVQIDFVVEIVINRDVGPCRLVYPIHVLVKGRSVAVVVIVAVGDEQIRVDHLVQ